MLRAEHFFIPARIADNKILLGRDPGYVDRLQMVGSPQLVKAWLETFAGSQREIGMCGCTRLSERARSTISASRLN